uniref:Uncharacterized protein n=1 Tax=Plectus sambesii TaxID=2011161 RepID=A0A914XPG1_9BILA
MSVRTQGTQTPFALAVQFVLSVDRWALSSTQQEVIAGRLPPLATGLTTLILWADNAFAPRNLFRGEVDVDIGKTDYCCGAPADGGQFSQCFGEKKGGKSRAALRRFNDLGDLAHAHGKRPVHPSRRSRRPPIPTRGASSPLTVRPTSPQSVGANLPADELQCPAIDSSFEATAESLISPTTTRPPLPLCCRRLAYEPSVNSDSR